MPVEVRKTHKRPNRSPVKVRRSQQTIHEFPNLSTSALYTREGPIYFDTGSNGAVPKFVVPQASHSYSCEIFFMGVLFLFLMSTFVAYANNETYDGLIEHFFWNTPKPAPAPISNPFTVLGLLRRLFDVRFDY